MIKFINAFSGTEMWVADERKEEYLAAGHKLAAELSAKPAEKEPEVAPKKVAAKKATKKK
ncbi:MAG: hypothetical protein IIZ78_18170 [Clostridiales bacterium]|nr:hypothetical protein [Clostridiales bacterium]